MGKRAKRQDVVWPRVHGVSCRGWMVLLIAASLAVLYCGAWQDSLQWAGHEIGGSPDMSEETHEYSLFTPSCVVCD